MTVFRPSLPPRRKMKISRRLAYGPVVAARAWRTNGPGRSDVTPKPARVNPAPRRKERREQSQSLCSLIGRPSLLEKLGEAQQERGGVADPRVGVGRRQAVDVGVEVVDGALALGGGQVAAEQHAGQEIDDRRSIVRGRDGRDAAGVQQADDVGAEVRVDAPRQLLAEILALEEI